jgi:hypothetical protein
MRAHRRRCTSGKGDGKQEKVFLAYSGLCAPATMLLRTR